MTDNHPYHGLSAYLKQQYGEKIYKISLDGGFTCPNRDGTIGKSGCIFCSAGGSGEFATPILKEIYFNHPADFTAHIHRQINLGRQRFHCKKVGQKFIAYFQAYTNTYGSADYLSALFEGALSHPDIVGISIATRPDCLGEEVISVFNKLRASFPDKFVWVELGLQTIHEQSASYIRRGYPLSCLEAAIECLNRISVPIIVHVILGLPFETDSDVLHTITYLNQKAVFGIKLQLLHILKGTDLARDYEQGKFEVLSKPHYLSLLINCIEHLDPSIVIHRVTGDGPSDLLIAPIWSLNKRDVLNSLHKQMREGGHYQGRLYQK